MPPTVVVIKPKRKPTEYNLFVGECRRKGMLMSAAAHEWNVMKSETPAQRQLRLERNEKLRLISLGMKASTIQRHWRFANSNPEYKLCRDRLAREFNELI